MMLWVELEVLKYRISKLFRKVTHRGRKAARVH